MQIAISDGDVREFMAIINRNVQEHPILVDKYLMGKEVEVDAVCDGEDILIPGIMEHVERAGDFGLTAWSFSYVDHMYEDCVMPHI